MNIYFDVEFTGLHKNTELISIGLVCDDISYSFYAEFTDYRKSREPLDQWIRDNVIANLKFNDRKDFFDNKRSIDPELEWECNEVTMKGDCYDIRPRLLKWLDEVSDGGKKNIQFVSDVPHYDFVLLIDLLYGNALHMPKNVAAVCHDLNTDIAKYFNMSEKMAFDLSRETIVTHLEELTNNHLDYKGDKHNSIYDAVVVNYIYNRIV